MSLPVRLSRQLVLIAALSLGCLTGITSARAAAGGSSIEPAQSMARSDTRGTCPPSAEIEAELGDASSLMDGSRFQDAASELQALAGMDCDPRVSLLFAAALEGQGNVPKATTVLQRAHAAWPANDSVAASLAREYLNSKQVDKAVSALAHFHVTNQTPEQEMRMAALVYMAGNRLATAQAVAEAAWKTYPSQATLLLNANTLQLQGRYPDVNRLLGSERAQYGDSPEFLVTIAESEFDGSSFKTARVDLQHAITLNPRMYQAHYLLGNVLAKLNDTEGAVAEYRKAIDLAPEQPRTYFQLALVLRAKQDEAGEQQALAQSIAADSRYAPAQCEMGRILLEGHHPADAVDHLNTAIEANPRSEEAYFLLARAYGQLGEKDKSNAMVKRLLAVKKENRPTQGGRSEPQPKTGVTTNP